MAAPAVPVPVVMARPIWSVAAVTTLPPASCSATVGWVPKAAPATIEVGVVVNASLAGAPTTTVNVLEVPAVRAVPVALSV